ncbi:hypothetical protein A2U01_0001713, partial [Trifolium medium]|nr:hypothetical protein [Trifolium medium]
MAAITMRGENPITYVHRWPKFNSNVVLGGPRNLGGETQMREGGKMDVVGPSTQPSQTVAEVTNDVEVPMPTQASQTTVVEVNNDVEVPMPTHPTVVAPKKRGRPRKPQTETSKPKKSKNVESANTVIAPVAPVIVENSAPTDVDNVASIFLGEDIDFAFNYDTI